MHGFVANYVGLLLKSTVLVARKTLANEFQLPQSEELFEKKFCSSVQPVPSKPKASQLWVLHIKLKPNVVLPAVYAYCNGAKGGLYKAILARLVELAPGLKHNLHTIVTDFEAAEINAIRSVFPTVRLRCCWFHYTQTVTRYWYDLKLEDAPQMILFFTWALALTPPEKFQEGLRIIYSRILLHSEKFPNLLKFHAYLQRQWLPKAVLVCVFEEDDRTNNSAEACNRHLTDELGGRKPTLWTLFFNLKQYIEQTDAKLTRVQHNIKITKTYTMQKQREDNERIRECQRKLSNEELDMEQFFFDIITEERQQEILTEMESLIAIVSVEPHELASNEMLLYAENFKPVPETEEYGTEKSSRGTRGRRGCERRGKGSRGCHVPLKKNVPSINGAEGNGTSFKVTRGRGSRKRRVPPTATVISNSGTEKNDTITKFPLKSHLIAIGDPS
ncbi:uncharacterized protein LOC107046137 isoform X2 [Diachasma alloeum]|uniref:uncharacterized protein LOC107046137 isoform X2 n=1 Tax=Diachasma alloeum TaxID=454923 RepID=UPI00073842A0|nr:uncharacterized protein LOC107046137 isoform X2 [Diachasma alloeum]